MCSHGFASFYDQIDNLWSPGYKPSDQDIIRCRAKTTGIVETTFHLGNLTYRMFDVGGQRSERKKWYAMFARKKKKKKLNLELIERYLGYIALITLQLFYLWWPSVVTINV